jgi:hypothetical protein
MSPYHLPDDWLDGERRRFRSASPQTHARPDTPVPQTSPSTDAPATQCDSAEPVCDAYTPFIEAACRRAADDHLKARLQQ